MKRALVTTGLAALLLLTGCTSTTTTETVTVTPSASGTYNDGDTTIEVKPLTAESPAASETDEASYLSEVRDEMPAKTVIPNATDAQLLEAGLKVCDLKAQGVNPDDWTVIDGEQRSELGYYNDTAAIAKAAVANLCN